MLDYDEVKKFYAKKLADDAAGDGRVESAFYHTMKMVYLKGVEDGQKEEQRYIGEAHHIGIIDHRHEYRKTHEPLF